MFDLLALCWMIYMFLAFIFTTFGMWGTWTLLAGLIIGIILQFLT